MTTRRDAIGNVIGRYGAGDRPVVLGSHFDTVPDAGSFDGPLGILAAIAVVERLAAGGAQPSAPVEVVAFADEEGMRFGTAFLGSAAYAGLFEPAWLELVDRDGITLEDAVRAAGGEDPRAAIRVATPELAAYLELHIEQGPVLEREGLPVGCRVRDRRPHARERRRPRRGGARRDTADGRHGATRSPLRPRSCSPSSASAAGPRGSSRRSAGWTSSPAPPTSSPAGARLPLDVRHPADDVRESALARLRARARGRGHEAYGRGRSLDRVGALRRRALVRPARRPRPRDCRGGTTPSASSRAARGTTPPSSPGSVPPPCCSSAVPEASVTIPGSRSTRATSPSRSTSSRAPFAPCELTEHASAAMRENARPRTADLQEGST